MLANSAGNLMTDIPEGRAKGGVARAASLSKEQRSAAAKKAAEARWTPKATHGSSEHPLRIGDVAIPCYVLEDGTRVLSQRGLQVGIGMSVSGGSKSGEQRLAVFVDSMQEKGIAVSDLAVRIRAPIKFLLPSGGGTALGYEATILADLCDLILAGRAAGVLQAQQRHLADQCEILVRGFARMGIIALVDEATGYEEVRERHALQALLDRYLRKEFAAWAKRFPDDFYREMFRLRGWEWPTPRGARPGIVGTYTVDLVYERLAPGVLQELEARNPKDDRGRRKAKHHQLLTEEVGHPALAQHLHAVMAFMRAAKTWDQFKKMVDVAFPKKGQQFPLMLDNPGAE